MTALDAFGVGIGPTTPALCCEGRGYFVGEMTQVLVLGDAAAPKFALAPLLE